MLEKVGGGTQATRLKKLPKHRPLVKEPYNGVVEGSFYTDDIQRLRYQLLSDGVPVRATLSGPHDLKALSIPIAKGKFCHVTSLPENNEDLRTYVEHLQLLSHTPLQYRNENLPALTQRLLFCLLAEIGNT